MENKKFNKLSIISLILILVGPMLISLDKFGIYVLKENQWVMYLVFSYIGSITFILGFIFAIISLYKIKKSGEKGKIISLITAIIFITILILILYLSFNN